MSYFMGFYRINGIFIIIFRWFVLTSNSLDIYKSPEKNSAKIGSVILNRLVVFCSFVGQVPHSFIHSFIHSSLFVGPSFSHSISSFACQSVSQSINNSSCF